MPFVRPQQSGLAMQLNYHSFGTGHPLLILHGLLGSADNWLPLARQWGERYHVLALDLRNHGHSPHGEPFDYATMAGDICEFMDAQMLPTAHVLGHSMGGKAAMYLALHFPERVSKLIVADIAPRAYRPQHLEIFDALLTLPLRHFSQRTEIDAALVQRIPESAVRQFLLKNLTRDQTGAFRWKIPLALIHKYYAGLNEALVTDRVFSAPTLFLRGERSAYIRETDTPLIQRLFPNAQIHTVAGAGHWLHADAPGEFSNLVSRFLAEA